jgi:APA family basic amino acid/polyamine antiporter
MIGAGVFLSAGFMAQDLGPYQILLAWCVGAVIALSGARAYAELAVILPRSGGEYRVLSDIMHPLAGYLAGWASILIGFSGPIAVDAAAASLFAQTVVSGLPTKIIAIAIVAIITCAHAFNRGLSARTQNVLVVVKVLLLAAFTTLGLVFGRHEPPTWTPANPSAAFPVAAFAGSLFYVGFAFSGWNAAYYSAEEFQDPKRQVSRAMVIGCGLVAAFYLLVNWVFVTNLTPARASAVFSYEETRITLGHLKAHFGLNDKEVP